MKTYDQFSTREGTDYPPRRRANLCCFYAAAMLVSAFAAMDAQPFSPTLAAGVAIPGGALGANRHAGPLIRAGLVFGDPTRIAQFRLEVENAWMPARKGAPTTPSSNSRDLESLGLFGLLTVGARTTVSPYIILGLGVQRLEAQGIQNPYGTTFGARAGVGVRGRVGNSVVYVEATPHGNLTDYAAGDFVAGYFFPIVAGVRF